MNPAFAISGLTSGIVEGMKLYNDLESSKRQNKMQDWQFEQAQKEAAWQDQQRQYGLASQYIAEVRRQGLENDPQAVQGFLRKFGPMFDGVINEGGPEGATKQIVGLMPHPQTKGKYSLNLNVTKPDGTSYVSAISRNRSSDPNDPYVAFEPKDWLGMAELHIAQNYENLNKDRQADMLMQKYQVEMQKDTAQAQRETYKTLYDAMVMGDDDAVTRFVNRLHPGANATGLQWGQDGKVYAVNAQGAPAMKADGVPIAFDVNAMAQHFGGGGRGSEGITTASPGSSIIDKRTGRVLQTLPSKADKPEMTEAQARKELMKFEIEMAKFQKTGEVDPMMMMLAKSMGIDPEQLNKGQIPEEIKQQVLAAADEHRAYLKQFIGGALASGGGGETRQIVQTGTDKKTGKKVVKYSDGTIAYAN